MGNAEDCLLESEVHTAFDMELVGAKYGGSGRHVERMVMVRCERLVSYCQRCKYGAVYIRIITLCGGLERT